MLKESTDMSLEGASPPPLSAPPASPGAAAIFATLPAELRVHTLAKLSSLIDLRQAIIASPDLHHAYMCNQRAVLKPVMKNAVRASNGKGGANQLWTRMWIDTVVQYVIEGKMSFEIAMGCVRARAFG